jgi:site-specific DNA-adenine methylase
MRAPFGWLGGKGRMASWVVQYIPQGKIYVEPFAGRHPFSGTGLNHSQIKF